MEAVKFDFVTHLARQAAWSKETFGPGLRTEGVSDHIRKELLEIAADPTDLKEWIDVMILALDGAWRCGGSPEQIIAGIVAKQAKNEGRNWPDWRTADPTKAIEHDRSGESAAAPQVVADERQEFEEWAKDHLGQGYKLEIEEHTYANPVTRWAFVAFRAGRKIAAALVHASNPVEFDGIKTAPVQVACQIYGHVVGHCGECNVGDEAADDVNQTNKILADNYLISTAPVQAQEPVGEIAGVWLRHGEAVIKLRDPSSVTAGQAIYTAPVQPVAVPEAAQQNGGLVRAALIDLLSPVVERAANSGAVSFECQSNIAAIFARGRQALAQSAFDTAPAAQGDAKDAERMDFLVSSIVEVRKEQRYGSSFMFISQAQYNEEQEFTGTTLRAQIDAAIAAKAAS